MNIESSEVLSHMGFSKCWRSERLKPWFVCTSDIFRIDSTGISKLSEQKVKKSEVWDGKKSYRKSCAFQDQVCDNVCDHTWNDEKHKYAFFFHLWNSSFCKYFITHGMFQRRRDFFYLSQVSTIGLIINVFWKKKLAEQLKFIFLKKVWMNWSSLHDQYSL